MRQEHAERPYVVRERRNGRLDRKADGIGGRYATEQEAQAVADEMCRNHGEGRYVVKKDR